MILKRIRSILDDWPSRLSFSAHQSETEIDPEQFQEQLSSEWKAFEVGSEPNVFETRPNEEHGIRIIPPHRNAAVLIQPMFGETAIPEEQTWKVAVQTKLKFWETGKQYVYETKAQGRFDTRQDVNTVLEVLTADLAAATESNDLPRTDDDSTETE